MYEFCLGNNYFPHKIRLLRNIGAGGNCVGKQSNVNGHIVESNQQIYCTRIFVLTEAIVGLSTPRLIRLTVHCRRDVTRSRVRRFAAATNVIAVRAGVRNHRTVRVARPDTRRVTHHWWLWAFND